LLGGAAAWLGVNLLDNVMSGPFSGGLFAPFGNWNQPIMSQAFSPGWGGGFGGFGGFGGGFGGFGGGGGILSNLAMNVLGLSPWGMMC
jgi:hypothetical protein